MSEPIPAFLNDVVWETVPPPETNSGDLPYATHSGVLELFGHKMKCFRLSTGQAVFDADDFHAFFEGMLAEEDAK